MRGAVLTGGASRRMGRDKALIEIDGRPMAGRVADALVAAGCHPVVAVGGDPRHLQPLGLHVVADAAAIPGPLAGILGAIDWFRSAGPDVATDERTAADPAWVLVVACDLPMLTAATLLPIVAATRAHPRAHVIVGRTDRIEPTVAAWRLDAAPRVRSIVTGGATAVHEVIEQLSTVDVAVDPDGVRNINTPDDLPRYP